MLEPQPKQHGNIHPFVPATPSPISKRTARVHASLSVKAAEPQARGVHPQNGQVISDPGSSSELLTPFSISEPHHFDRRYQRSPAYRESGAGRAQNSSFPRQKDVGPPSVAAEKEIPVNLEPPLLLHPATYVMPFDMPLPADRRISKLHPLGFLRIKVKITKRLELLRRLVQGGEDSDRRYLYQIASQEHNATEPTRRNRDTEKSGTLTLILVWRIKTKTLDKQQDGH
ncbi:hypothetical protein E4U13_004193 [Claviceps humidiphila]|uniref:Uncharacterized protein n=1 Tax=Claviceps humidiphila TaxID=1294629 RepID=A0A9P7TRW6_9HYPO|nr:hypothetical protein E4U13_004193 [Claviceps humidiphila]